MAEAKKRIDFRKFFLNIILPTVLSIGLFIVVIFWYIIPYFERNLLESKKEMIRELVNSTISIAGKNYSDYRAGKISEREAQNDAIDKIRNLRYGAEDKDYFFITDMNPNMIMHPYRPELNGSDLAFFKDPNGKALFMEMVNKVKLSGEGFVDYKWQWMDDSLNIVPKISYVREFKPWGWVIGTGIYIEDIREKLSIIERELIIVSIGISGIIALLLTIIVYQNLKTEIKRTKAESELLVSKEKYKTLVEASTEGTAMVLDGELIYSNRIFDEMFFSADGSQKPEEGSQVLEVRSRKSEEGSQKSEVSILNYEGGMDVADAGITDGSVTDGGVTDGGVCSTELIDKLKYLSSDLREIMSIKNNDSKEKLLNFINSESTFFQMETEILISDKEPRNVLLSLSKITLSDKNGLIVMVKELSGENARQSERSKWGNCLVDLFEVMKRGMFKLSMGDNGRFVDVNDEAAEILGYGSKDDFVDVGILEIVENKPDWINLMKRIKMGGFVSDFHLRVRRANGKLATLLIDAKYEIDLSDNEEYINGVFSDITEQIEFEGLKEATYGEIQSSRLRLNQELRSYMRETISCNMNLNAEKAALLMTRNNTDVLLVRSSAGEPVGIVTDSDIRSRLLGTEGGRERAVYEIMSSPVFSLKESSMLSEAIVKMDEKGIHHILVKNSGNEITGIIGVDEILRNQYSSSHLLLLSIEKANCLADLVNIYKRLPFFVGSAIAGGVKPDFIIRTISLIASAITSRISELIFLEIGEPPASFAFVSLGSEGREEQTLVTDQDNAIIYDDIAHWENTSHEESSREEVENYFARFAERMNYMLDAVGYSYCKGGVMAKNPKWNKPLSVWKKYFKEWITNPEPQNLLEIAVFFDMKLTFGSHYLLDELLEYVNSVLKENTAFFGFLARVGVTYKTQLSFFGKIQTESIEEHSKSVNVKNALRVIVSLVRLYAMKYNLSETNTVKRLKLLYEMNVFSEQLYKDIVFSYDFLSMLQLKTQVNSILHKSKPVNYIDLTDLSSIEVSSIKNIFSQVSTFQSKLKYDFGLSE